MMLSSLGRSCSAHNVVHSIRASAIYSTHRRAMMSALSSQPQRPPEAHSSSNTKQPLKDSPPVVVPTAKLLSSEPASPQVAARPPPVPKAERPRPTIRSTKAVLSMTPTAIQRLRGLLNSPTPQLIRISVRNKGCAGLSYHLDYVEKPEKFDEVVHQDGIKVLIDSKALFSIIGSEMDWKEDALSSKFVFNNPNIKDACGCGESFTVA
ncbi:hypothetical protein DFJ58DRAFT_714731 [Suillus subalutaceus]|uniref:uncharacterized protein n=1 Tax=Suillus subalutaceus TaxID=48586 RepID=UPI001B8806AB|nr:uncharacterized protein DFJ58DRAFT_714731 [Suillus subalutaceus]KAG1865512.1 hypothetical protein DFJ58DRAFT_714731 [Suillus subalutaceus]